LQKIKSFSLVRLQYYFVWSRKDNDNIHNLKHQKQKSFKKVKRNINV